MDYIRKHWRGELLLVTSFWVNVFFLNIFLRLTETWLDESSPFEHPVTGAQVVVAFFFITVFVVYPWQIVGVWRSAIRYSEQLNSGIWGGAVRVVVVFGVLGTLGNLSISLPVYKDLFQLGFGKDEYSDYQISLTDDGSLIHLQGDLGFGVSEDVKRLLAESPGVTGIILDSRGGRIYEGRHLANMILISSIDTYSLKGCYSACGTAFISGNRRYLAEGANLAFHQYHLLGDSLAMYVDMDAEQQKDLSLYQRRGISPDFIERIFTAEQDDLWYPTIDELLAADVVHEIVKPSDIRPVEYGDFGGSDLEDEIAKYAAFRTIKTYEPDLYNELMANLNDQIREGASGIELQQTVAGYVEILAGNSLPLTSDRALIVYVGETIVFLEKLENIEPILCLKNLYPDQYGSLDVSRFLTIDDIVPMMNALSLVISDRYATSNPDLDVAAAEELITEVAEQLGDDAYYLDSPSLNGSEEYSKACRTFIRYYELILAYDQDAAANGLRYAFSP